MKKREPRSLFVLVVSLLILAFGRLEAQEANSGKGEAPDLRGRVVRQAEGYLGIPYRYGGLDRDGIDCSGFTYRVYLDAAGGKLPRQTDAQFQAGRAVNGGFLPGDLLFFNTTGAGVSHVGLYLGESRFIHAASEGPQTGVIVSSLEEDYYARRYLGARRVIPYSTGEVTLNADKPSGRRLLPESFIAGVPVKLMLAGDENRTGTILLRIFKDGREFQAQRLRFADKDGGDRSAPVFWFTPGQGDWEIRMENGSQKVLSVTGFRVRV